MMKEILKDQDELSITVSHNLCVQPTLYRYNQWKTMPLTNLRHCLCLKVTVYDPN